jgi:cytoskeletal protein RodZ
MSSSTMAQSLNEIRRKKGISLSQIAESTKIGTFFLEAIENEQFGKLPGGVFSRSYIRQYSAAVGISDKELLEAYAEYEAEKERKELPPAGPESQKKSGLRRLVSLLVS